MRKSFSFSFSSLFFATKSSFEGIVGYHYTHISAIVKYFRVILPLHAQKTALVAYVFRFFNIFGAKIGFLLQTGVIFILITHVRQLCSSAYRIHLYRFDFSWIATEKIYNKNLCIFTKGLPFTADSRRKFHSSSK